MRVTFSASYSTPDSHKSGFPYERQAPPEALQDQITSFPGQFTLFFVPGGRYASMVADGGMPAARDTFVYHPAATAAKAYESPIAKPVANQFIIPIEVGQGDLDGLHFKNQAVLDRAWGQAFEGAKRLWSSLNTSGGDAVETDSPALTQ